MRQLRPFICALLSSAGFILLMFTFQTIMMRKASMWAEMDAVIPLYERVLLSISTFWYKFWILLAPFIIAFPMAVAFLVALRRAK